MAMITTRSHSPWPGDVDVEDPAAAGLRAPCRVRLKVFTLDNRLIRDQIGALSAADQRAVASSLREHLSACGP